MHKYASTFFVTGAFLGCVLTVFFFVTLSGFLASTPNPAPDYLVGWIDSEIYFQNAIGDVISMPGACLVEEDMYILDAVCPESVDILEGEEVDLKEVSF